MCHCCASTGDKIELSCHFDSNINIHKLYKQNEICVKEWKEKKVNRSIIKAQVYESNCLFIQNIVNAYTRHTNKRNTTKYERRKKHRNFRSHQMTKRQQQQQKRSKSGYRNNIHYKFIRLITKINEISTLKSHIMYIYTYRRANEYARFV